MASGLPREDYSFVHPNFLEVPETSQVRWFAAHKYNSKIQIHCNLDMHTFKKENVYRYTNVQMSIMSFLK